MFLSRAAWTRLEGHIELHGMSKDLQKELIDVLWNFISEADAAHLLSDEIERGEGLLRRVLKEATE